MAKSKTVIAVDASGGDYAPHEVVKGAVKAVEEYGVEVTLVGKKSVLHVLVGRELNKPGLTIVDADQVIESDESPMKALKTKPNSSIMVGVNLLKEGKAAAFVSAGNTGALFGAALLTLGRIKDIERPAIACTINFTATPVLLIDAGANADCRPNQLVHFAKMGSIYSRQVLGISSPRVGLLSNGAEDAKGNQLVLETNQLLRTGSHLNFVGNIEAQDVLKAAVDVVVTDGFTGNIMVKTIEGMSDNFLVAVRQIGRFFSSAYQHRGRDLLKDISMLKRMDYREYGGAIFLGVDGNIVKAHGRSRAHTIKNAIGLAKQMVDHDILGTIKGESYG
jgi:glycerol-3-phosphate acyltransferase PlsX